MALEEADISVQEIAVALGVSRSTVSRWLHDQDEPKEIYLKSWAEACVVDYQWLAGPEPPRGGGLTILDLINRTVENQDDPTVNCMAA